MQEEVENRTLTLVVSGTKFTGRLLKAAISKYISVNWVRVTMRHDYRVLIFPPSFEPA